MKSLPKGTVTFLFTDIEGSTRLVQALGPRYAEVLAEHCRIVREAIADAGGTEVSTEGDSFFAVFPSAPAAVAATSAAQRALAAQAWPDDAEVRVRMGLHTGEAIKEEADFYGKNIVLAARIADEARGGEILASSVVKQLTESAGDLRFEDQRELELDGLAGKHMVYKVL